MLPNIVILFKHVLIKSEIIFILLAEKSELAISTFTAGTGQPSLDTVNTLLHEESNVNGRSLLHESKSKIKLILKN